MIHFHFDKINDFIITQKAEVLSSIGLLMGSVSLVDEISPYLQLILLVFSITSLGISIFLKVEGIIAKRKKKK